VSLVAESHTYVLVHVCEVSELAKAGQDRFGSAHVTPVCRGLRRAVSLVAESHTHVLVHVCVVSELAFRA
jgi:hypothetical protein